MEFTAMEDIGQAAQVEALLQDALPWLALVDTTSTLAEALGGAPTHHADGNDWMLRDLSRRAELHGGRLTMHRFVRDAIDHRDKLAPLFNDLKRSVANTYRECAANEAFVEAARGFRPGAGMTLAHAFVGAVFRSMIVDRTYRFVENDSTDLVHAIPAALRCDFALLDRRWCARVEVAGRRLARAGFTGRIAETYSKQNLGEFFRRLASERQLD